MAQLSNKVVAITGAASGIGLAVAKKLASHGALLSLADINSDALEAIVPALIALYPTSSPTSTASSSDPQENGEALQEREEQHYRGQALKAAPSISDASLAPAAPSPAEGSRILTTVLDVADARSCISWVEKTIKHFNQPLSAAANMAGIIGPSYGSPHGPIRHLPLSELHTVTQVNAYGTFHLLRAQLPHMATFPLQSSIVNAASIAGLMGVAGNAPYVMSKHAIVGLTKTAAKEEGARGIRINAVAPGVVDTPMVEGIGRRAGTTELFDEGRQPGVMGRMGRSEEVADLVCFLLGAESSFVTGMVYGVDGGWMC